MASPFWRRFFREELSRPERLAGRLWGILVVLSVTGSVDVLLDARTEGTRTVLLVGLGSLAAWSLVEATMSTFEGLVVRGRETHGGRDRAAPIWPIVATGLGDGAFLFVGGLPILVPLLLPNPQVGLRVSNLIAIASLAVLGVHAGRAAGGRPVVWAFAMVVVGAVLVASIVLLGG